MERRTFGKTGLQVSVLGFGGAELGFDDGVDEARAAAVLHPAIEAGLNVVDTASAYLASEQLLGKVLQGKRDKILLFSKCGATDGFSRSDWSAAGIRAQVEQSLKALKTDHLDLLQLHSCAVAVLEKGEAIETIEALKREGKTRFIGYSGDAERAAWAVKSGRFDTLQTSINVADQAVLEAILPAAAKAGMGVIAKRPVANVAWKHGDDGPANSYHGTYFDRLRALDFDFTRGPLAQAVDIALRFTVFQPGVSTAIVGTSSPGRWATNAASVEKGPLAADQIAAIRARWNERSKPGWTGQQ
jgi:aryl-alcohol dehydrogenase-like predicted oxidoreductase